MYVCNKGICFSFIIFLQLRKPIESKFSQICCFIHDWIHHKRITVFDNYQMFSVPLIPHKMHHLVGSTLTWTQFHADSHKSDWISESYRLCFGVSLVEKKHLRQTQLRFQCRCETLSLGFNLFKITEDHSGIQTKWKNFLFSSWLLDLAVRLKEFTLKGWCGQS